MVVKTPLQPKARESDLLVERMGRERRGGETMWESEHPGGCANEGAVEFLPKSTDCNHC